MKKKNTTNKIFLQILICLIFCLNVTISGYLPITNNNLSLNDIFTLTDFTRFSYDEERSYLNIDVTSSTVLIDHNQSYATGSQEKFEMEFNIGHEATFRDFDIWIDITYDLTLPPFWGDLMAIIGQDYQPNVVVSNDIRLGYVQIKDPWGSADGVFGAGQGVIINEADNETVMPNPSAYKSALFHLTRNGSAVLCEVIQDSLTKVSFSWTEEEVLLCNYIRLELSFWGEVEEFSFTLSNLNAVLDIDGEISTMQLHTIIYFEVLIFIGIITRISIKYKKKI